jgi:hypothetical protein
LCPGFESLIRHQIEPMPRLLFAVVIACLLAACGTSTTRLADGTMVGTMTTHSLPVVTIDGREHRLAPGARIVGRTNTTITPNQVPPNSRVRYRVDASGQVSHVWLLPADR